MFKELYNDLILFLKEEPLDTPGFMKNVPADLMTSLRGLYSLGNDMDKYRTFVYNKEQGRIFIIYKDLIDDANHATINDVILYKGEFVHLIILDYDLMFGSVPNTKPEDVVNMIFIAVYSSVVHLKAKHVSMFYKNAKSEVLVTLFSEAITILFIQLMRSIYGDGSDLARSLTIKMIKTLEYSKEFTDEDYDAYCAISDNNSIEFLLDCSVIASVKNPLIPERDIPEGENNEETLQRNPS